MTHTARLHHVTNNHQFIVPDEVRLDQDRAEWRCGHGNEPVGSVKVMKLIDSLSDFRLLTYLLICINTLWNELKSLVAKNVYEKFRPGCRAVYFHG